MSGRLLSWPNGLGVTSFDLVGSPLASGEGQTPALAGLLQQSVPIKAPTIYQIGVPPLQGALAREFNAILFDAHNYGNAIVFPFTLAAEQLDPLSIGLTGPQQQNWSNGQPWNNGQGWSGGYPNESIAADQSKDYSTVTLGSDAWGDHLQKGDWFGFIGHYAVYQVMAPDPLIDGKVRIWPPLRKAVTTSDSATLEPTIVVRLIGAPQRSKTRNVWEGGAIQVVEIPDEKVRTHYDLA